MKLDVDKEYTLPVMSIDDFLNRSSAVDEYDAIIADLTANDDYRSVASASTTGSLSHYSYATDALEDEYMDFPEDISGSMYPYAAEQKRNEVTTEPRKSVFVRFASDAEGQVLSTVHKFDGYSRSQKKNIWYHARDFVKFKRKVQSKMGAASVDFLSMYTSVRSACKVSEQSNDVKHRWPLRIAESKYRGIEPFLYQSTMKERKTVVQGVLSEQRYWTSLGAVATPTERANAIGEHSRSLTKPHRRLAHLLGSGDAAIARRIAWDKRPQETDVTLEI